MLPEFWRTPRLGPNFRLIKCSGAEGVVRCSHLNLAKRSDQILVMCFGEKNRRKTAAHVHLEFCPFPRIDRDPKLGPILCARIATNDISP